jgi:hypothetical protein
VSDRDGRNSSPATEFWNLHIKCPPTEDRSSCKLTSDDPQEQTAYQLVQVSSIQHRHTQQQHFYTRTVEAVRSDGLTSLRDTGLPCPGTLPSAYLDLIGDYLSKI